MILALNLIYFVFHLSSAKKCRFLTLDVLVSLHRIGSGSPHSSHTIFGFFYLGDDKVCVMTRMRRIKITMDDGDM